MTSLSAQTPPNGFDYDYTDTDGNIHNIQDYFDDEKSVFIFYISNDSWSFQIYEWLNLADFYNTNGQGGNSDVIVLCMAVSGFDTFESLSNLDYSETLGGGYENVSFTENNPIPIIINPMSTNEIKIYGAFDLNMYCYDDNYTNFQSGNAEMYMEVLYELCCTSVETYDPGLKPHGSGQFDCDPFQVNFVLNNGSPVAFNATDIDVFINGIFDSQITSTETVEGCSGVELIYSNTSLTGDMDITFAIANLNENNTNDTLHMYLTNVDTVRGRIRIELLNFTDTDINGRLRAGYGLFERNFAKPENEWRADIFLTSGCYDLHGDLETVEPVTGTFLVMSIDEYGIPEDTLSMITYNNEYPEYFDTKIFVEETVEPRISGYIFEDIDNFQYFDPSFPRIGGVEVTHGVHTVFSNSDGYYELPGAALTTPISINYDESVWPVITTTNPFVIFNLLYYLPNFGLSSDDPLDSLSLWFNANLPMICEENLYQSFTVTNSGNQSTEGELTITYDPILDPIAFSPDPDNIDGNILTYSIPEIPLNGSYPISITYDGQSADLTGEAVITDAVLHFYNASNTLSLGDSIHSQDTIFCSYDPNDIYGFPLGTGSEGFIPANTPLDYRIRFQNTGNFPATNVVITDTLPLELNWDSFVPKSASHEYSVQLNEETREIRWTFANINLPDSASDPEGSNGNVWYEIQMNDLDQGEQILNQAAIYFDLNAPIITNMSTHTIQGVTSVAEIDGEIPFSLFPNPVNDQLFLTFDNAMIRQLRIFDLQGRKCLEVLVNDKSNPLNIDGLESGMYILSVTNVSDQKEKSVRFVKL